MRDQLHQQLMQWLQMAASEHHTYETTVLEGVHDAQWPEWYARWLIEQRLNEMLETELTAEALSQQIIEINAAYEQSDKSESWNTFTANALIARYR
jgi:hypothetical protein